MAVRRNSATAWDENAVSWVGHLPTTDMVDPVRVRRLLAADHAARRKAMQVFDILKFALVPGVPVRSDDAEGR